MRMWWKWVLATVVLLLVSGAYVIGGLSRQPKLPNQTNPFFAALPDVVTGGDLQIAGLAVQGAKGQDLSGKDFSQAPLANMYDLTSDTQTRWPGAARLPAGFDPGRALAWGKDPGLGLRALHGQGIDGRGIAVAVFDKPIRQSHQEFAGRIHYIEVFPGNPRNKTYHFHGAAVASILAGKTVGVAPAATLYYFAVPDNGQNIANYLAAMAKLLALNETLPPAERIRVVNISDGFDESMLGREDVAHWDGMIRKAEGQGIVVVTGSPTFPVRYELTGVMPEQDRNDPENYYGSGHALLVPAGTRTTAGNESDTAYTYWGRGGSSWAAPYLAGLAALGLEVNPAATPGQLYAALTETATTTNGRGLTLVNPTGFIQRVSR
ncbi:MAG TPA: S8 family serine peptidase [Symbiobacteriaceae bacterium]|jgi:hypothetical protein